MNRYDFGAIRALRKQKKLTIQQLADRCGLTSPTVVAIETNKSAPSLASLDQMAAALDLTTTSLLLLCQKNRVLKSAARVLSPAQLPSNARLESCKLASYGDVRVFRVKGQPGMYTDSNLPHGDVFELNYVLSGSIELTVEQEKVVLKQDETAFFDGLSCHRHLFLAEGEILVMLVPKSDFNIHSLFAGSSASSASNAAPPLACSLTTAGTCTTPSRPLPY